MGIFSLKKKESSWTSWSNQTEYCYLSKPKKMRGTKNSKHQKMNEPSSKSLRNPNLSDQDTFKTSCPKVRNFLSETSSMKSQSDQTIKLTLFALTSSKPTHRGFTNWVRMWMKFCCSKKRSLGLPRKWKTPRRKTWLRSCKERCHPTSCKTLRRTLVLSCSSKVFTTKLQLIFQTWSTKFTLSFLICWPNLTKELPSFSDNNKRRCKNKNRCKYKRLNRKKDNRKRK